MTKQTVWMVEQGEYDDYNVVGIFSSKEYAQIIADFINAPGKDHQAVDPARIVERPLDPAVHELRQGYLRYTIRMQEDGTVEQLLQHGVYGEGVEAWMLRRSTLSGYRGRNLADLLVASVWAKNEAHALEIVNEHRSRMIATGEWKGCNK